LSALEGRDISVYFGTGSKRVAANASVSVEIRSGSVVGLVGESGSGKSTFGRVLAGLQTPSAGEVVYEGRKIFDSRHRFERSSRAIVQLVFQDPYSSLNPSMTAWQSVAEVLRVWHRRSRAAARSEALDLLQSLGLGASEAGRKPRHLSGGQRQRVSVARALAVRPDFLIADEPTASIDQSAQAQLLALFRRVVDDFGVGMLFISHDLRVVRYLTTEVHVMKDGCVVERGETAKVLNEPSHPYTRALISSSPGFVRSRVDSPPSAPTRTVPK